MALPIHVELTHVRFLSSPPAGEVVDRLRRAAKIYVTAHILPDGDTIGSALGLYWTLVSLGKQVRVACADPVPESFTFLPGHELIKPQKPNDDELIVVLDSSDLQRLGHVYDAVLYRDRPLDRDAGPGSAHRFFFSSFSADVNAALQHLDALCAKPHVSSGKGCLLHAAEGAMPYKIRLPAEEPGLALSRWPLAAPSDPDAATEFG